MARKKRITQTTAPAEATENKPKEQYQDSFQQAVGSSVEKLGSKLEGQGRNILYGLAAIAVLAVVVAIIYNYSSRSNAAAQAALGKAIKTASARVTDTPVPAGSTEVVYKTDAERAEAAIKEFQAVADTYGGAVGEKAKYFLAVNKLVLDRAAGIAELETLAKSSDDTGKMAKFALAQTKEQDGKSDEAIAIYNELLAMSDPIVAKDTLNFSIAEIYVKQDKKKEAADIFYTIAKTASELKDKEGKAVPMSSTARDAKEKLEELAPERAAEIKEEAPASPFGM